MSDIYLLLKTYEGLGSNLKDGRYFPYECSLDPKRADGSKPYTCGYGHAMSKTEEKDGVNVGGKFINVMRDGLSLEESEQLLAQDTKPRLTAIKQQLGEVSDFITGAFLDCVFNSGEQCLFSTPGVAIKLGMTKTAAERLLLYCMASGVKVRGLWRRRLSDSIFMLSGQVVIVNDKVPSNHKPSDEELTAMTTLSNLLGSRVILPVGLL